MGEALADLLGTLPISVDNVIAENQRAQIALARAVGNYAASTADEVRDRLDCDLSVPSAAASKNGVRRMLAMVAARPLAHDDKFGADDRLADLVGLLSTDKLCGYMQTEFNSDRLHVPGVAPYPLQAEVQDAVAATRSLFATSLILETLLLQRARFEQTPDLSGIALMDARMRFADLHKLTLSNAFLSGDFSSADFGSSTMGMVDLRFAKLFSIDHGNEYKLEENILKTTRPDFIAKGAWYDTHFKGAVIYAMRLPDLRSQERGFRTHQCNNVTIKNVYPPDFSGIRWWNISKDRTPVKSQTIGGFTTAVWKMRYPKEAFSKKLDVVFPTKSLCRPVSGNSSPSSSR
ncbi:MAG: hypothetical protein IAI50_21250 [Candidatus Eremiobacteraeota bacterium]|nr:hypothetical protein [Candidatus Eremiobacteraeota bacterium]